MHQPHSCFWAFALDVSSAWRFPCSYDQVLFKCLSFQVTSLATQSDWLSSCSPSNHPVFTFTLCIFRLSVCGLFPPTEYSSLRAETMTVSFTSNGTVSGTQIAPSVLVQWMDERLMDATQWWSQNLSWAPTTEPAWTLNWKKCCGTPIAGLPDSFLANIAPFRALLLGFSYEKIILITPLFLPKWI